MAREGLGDFEQLVLLAILRLGGEAYGVPILSELEGKTRRRSSRAAVYIALRRLERRGLVRSRFGEPTSERGGKPKRFFRITRSGVTLLKQTRSELQNMWAGLEPILEK